MRFEIILPECGHFTPGMKHKPNYWGGFKLSGWQSVILEQMCLVADNEYNRRLPE